MHHVDVVDADVAERALEHAWRADRRHQRRIAAEAAAVDADAVLVRIALVDGPLGGIDDVVLDAVAPLLVARVLERAAVAARTAEVHLQHRITAAGEHLCFAVEAPVVARPDRAAMRIDDQRQVLAVAAGRQRQVAVHRLAVAGIDAEGLDAAHALGIQPLAALHQETGGACLAVEQVQLPRVAVAAHAHHDLVAIARRAGEVHDLAGERFRKRGVNVGVRVAFVEQRHVRRRRFGHHADQGLVVARPEVVGHFRDIILEQLLEFAGLRVERADGGRGLAVVLLRIDRAVAGGGDHRQVLAGRLRCIDQGPLASITSIQLGALVVLAVVAHAGGADCEANFLGGVERQAATRLRRAADRRATAGEGVHAHHFRVGALGGTGRTHQHQHLTVIVVQRVDHRETLVADGFAALCCVACAAEDHRRGLAAIGVHRIPLAEQERRGVAAHLARGGEHQAVGPHPVEARDALLVRQLGGVDDLEVAQVHHRQHVLLASIHRDGQVTAVGRDLRALERREAGEVLDGVGLRGLREGRCRNREGDGERKCPGNRHRMSLSCHVFVKNKARRLPGSAWFQLPVRSGSRRSGCSDGRADPHRWCSRSTDNPGSDRGGTSC